MKDGKFTPEERKHLLTLNAVAEVRARSIVYTPEFKKECMGKYHQGGKPGEIFSEAGLPSTLIGYKRIERCFYHWKEAERKGSLTATPAPQVRHRRLIDTMKRQKREAVARQQAIRARDHAIMEGRIMREKKRSHRREEQIIASQARRLARQQEKITALKAQVRALKALGTLARKTRRAPRSTAKADRFQTIHSLTEENPGFNITAACEALEVSRRGYYDWLHAEDTREQLEVRDLAAKAQVQAAFTSHGFRKGSRLIVDNLRREQGIIMNRKKVQRIMRKYGIIYRKRRRNPYHPIGVDGQPKVAPNIVNRHFRTGKPLKVLSTDITYLPCRDKGFVYLSGVIDDETNMILAHKASTSMEEKFVLDTYDQLKNCKLPANTYACSDQGVHYTALAYRKKLRELGISQSMSRRGCCWDNAPIESFWGRLKEQIGPTRKLTAKEIIDKVDRYIDYYNNIRGQKRLGWMTPNEYLHTIKTSS